MSLTHNPKDRPLVSRVRSRNQITLPQSVCESAELQEGSFVEVQYLKEPSVVPPGAIVLSPQQFAPRNQVQTNGKLVHPVDRRPKAA